MPQLSTTPINWDLVSPYSAGGAQAGFSGGGFDPASISGYGVQGMPQPDFSGITPTGAAMGGIPDFGSPGWLANSGIGLNMPTFNMAVGGLKTIGDLWGAMQQIGLAKQQLGFTKQVTNANLQNQTKSYNTSLSDRANARGVAEGLTPAAVQDYIAKNSLSTPRVG